MSVLARAVATVVMAAAQTTVPFPPIDLPALLLQQVPPGFVQLPDQPGRLGPLDPAAAAGVLDESGRVQADMLIRAGFNAGYSRAWSKQDSGDVIVDVLLAFHTDRQARTFTRGFLTGRRQTTKPFEVPGTPPASGFERGPANPSRDAPAQREVVIQHGRVVAIVVLAGFATYPSGETALALAQAQRATLAQVAPTSDPPVRNVDEERTGWRGIAMLLLVGVSGWMVAMLHQYPVVGARRDPVGV